MAINDANPSSVTNGIIVFLNIYGWMRKSPCRESRHGLVKVEYYSNSAKTVT